jgi:hypothetical protein
MTFFARPNLSEEQFKQLAGTTLILSGQTQVKTITGLTLHNNSVGTCYPEIIITAENADVEVNSVLTYDGLGKIKLVPPSALGGDPVYNPPYKSPAAVTLCGINAGYILTGKTLSCIIETLLVPILNPTTVTLPSISSFTINPSTTIYEVGACPSISVTACFNRGCISPQYCGACCYRSGLPVSYNYIVFGGACTIPSGGACCNCTALTLPTCIQVGCGNIISGTVSYNAGSTPAYDSSGGIYCPTLSAGATASQSIALCGQYPYFYGKITCACPAGVGRPTPSTICSCIIAGCNKAVADSMSTICVRFCSDSSDYLWFAIPTASTCKTKWYVDALNNGSIGGSVSAGGNLFPDPNSVTNITTACWNNQTYKVYVSNYQTSTKCCSGACCYIMELRNS